MGWDLLNPTEGHTLYDLCQVSRRENPLEQETDLWFSGAGDKGKSMRILGGFHETTGLDSGDFGFDSLLRTKCIFKW